MPSATRPADANKLVRMFNLFIDQGGGEANMGTIKAGKGNVGKQMIDILSNTTSLPTSRIEFLEPPLIEATTLDINWTLLGEICGLTVSDITAGTENYATDIGFAIHDTYMVAINGESYTGADSIVLNSAADGGGTTYTKDDDYVVNETTGEVQCIPTGTNSLADGTTVYVESGTYTTVDSKRVNLTTGKINTEGAVRLAHTTTDSKTLTIKMWKANISSPLDLTFVPRDDVMGVPLIFNGLDDTANHASNPLGYLDITE